MVQNLENLLALTHFLWEDQLYLINDQPSQDEKIIFLFSTPQDMECKNTQGEDVFEKIIQALTKLPQTSFDIKKILKLVGENALTQLALYEEKFHIQKIISFDVTIHATYNLEQLEKYTYTTHQGKDILYVDTLASIEVEILKKKILWLELQKMFLPVF